jgi:uncharacterized protein (DUF488 family)
MAGVQERLIYTLGSSTRSPEEFIELLKEHHIETIADVRKFPRSRFEHFCKENLPKLLEEAGISYSYMGRELGGYRKEGYQNFTATPEFQSGLRELEKVAQVGRTAIVCAERFPWRCHRHFIGLELQKKGWQVSHIIDKGRYWLPQEDTR